VIELQAACSVPAAETHTLSIAQVLFADTRRNIDRWELGPLIEVGIGRTA